MNRPPGYLRAVLRAVVITDGALPGGPPVYDVAFRSYTQEPILLGSGATAQKNYWMEAAQANALATGDVSAFALDVRWAQLASRTWTPAPLAVGYSERWYVSSLDPGPGFVNRDVNAGPGDQVEYQGRIQPYAVYVPTGYRGRPTSLTFLNHSLLDNFNQYAPRIPTSSRPPASSATRSA